MSELQRIYSENGFAGKAKEIGSDVLEDDGESVKNRSYVMIYERPDGITLEDVEEGIRGMYARGRCACEHDCCGHWFGGVHSIGFKDNVFTIITHYYKNV